MTDIFTPQKRSEVMSRIHSRDTKPELALRSLLHRMGYRFTVNGPHNRTLPGKPDLVLPKYHTVVFVHGCFWHAHEGCPHFRLPKSRRAWLEARLPSLLETAPDPAVTPLPMVAEDETPYRVEPTKRCDG